MTTTTAMPTTMLGSVRLDEVSIRIGLPGSPRRWVHAAERVSLDLVPGRVTAVVGESGCGKSVLALALMGLLPAGTITAGAIHYGDVDLLTASERVLQGIRGGGLGLIPQSAATHLNPVRTVGSTMAEALAAHGRPTGPNGVRALLDELALPAGTLDRYPHELSGGMAQRVLVAMTLALRPPVTVADEPTSALDPGTARLVLAALRNHADAGHAVMLITHDLVAAREVADTVAVMYAGRLMEIGPVDPVLVRPRHGYSRALLDALPENGMTPAPGLPSSLVDPDPSVCAWHTRVGVPCVPAGRVDDDHWLACVPAGWS
ncbi:ABC transporter ATP-binding protein [Aeromicrobium wangtongii]|uniref:ABC transporter ATP-binding protein n=1 Tax=Aeromicrobium wangtongii TaxID=2969247 RepID=UPI002017F2E8|nr:ABC transporter ATP-binding protein [Aeromicrobium wangtongii]MCL3818677.1 ABC transporter ATP-binding protein [Aeromicrobium wangtongii]